jgi:uncharacterized protein (TIGR04141 family)
MLPRSGVGHNRAIGMASLWQVVVRVTLYLLREGTKLVKQILRKHELYQERALREPADAEVEWRLYVRAGIDVQVGWFKHVSPLLADGQGGPLWSKSAGAVLLVSAHGRIFAVTFGTGFHALSQAVIVPDFGLIVTANCIDVDRLTTADARGLGKGKRNASSRLPLPGEMFALGLLTNEEWIRRFGGEVSLTGFAKSASGADSLQLNIQDFHLIALPAKLKQVLNLYESKAYQANFPFLDYFRRETDRETITALDAAMSSAMKKRDPEIGFAAPDELDLHADEYRLSVRRDNVRLDELRTDDVYAAIDTLNAWADPLAKVKIASYDLAGEPILDREPLRPYVVGEVRMHVAEEDRQYATTAGAWFRINPAYVEIIDRYLRDDVVDLTAALSLPTWDDDYLQANVKGKYGEERYNRHVSQQQGYVLLDRDLYRGRAGEKVEICDLLTPDKKLICVKRMDGSDKLSHLFQQGSVSAQLIMANDDYRAKLMAAYRRIVPDGEFGNPSEWTVVYALATGKPGELKKIMYFFSRAALKTHGTVIKGTGIKVAVAKIDR